MGQTIGQRIRAIRRGLGVGEFANALGINRKTVTRWEADQALPDGASLLALNEKFGADPGWVLVGDGEGPDLNTLTAEERRLIELFRASPQVGRAAAIGALQSVAQAPHIHIAGENLGQVGGSISNQGDVLLGKSRKGRQK